MRKRVRTREGARGDGEWWEGQRAGLCSSHSKLQGTCRACTKLMPLQALCSKQPCPFFANARVVNILSRRTKNNPVILGDPGVGKTALVDGLAQRIVTGDVPDVLKDCVVVALDMGMLMAGEVWEVWKCVFVVVLDMGMLMACQTSDFLGCGRCGKFGGAAWRGGMRLRASAPFPPASLAGSPQRSC